MSDNSSDTRSGIINSFIILHSRLIDKFMQFLALLGVSPNNTVDALGVLRIALYGTLATLVILVGVSLIVLYR